MMIYAKGTKRSHDIIDCNSMASDKWHVGAAFFGITSDPILSTTNDPMKGALVKPGESTLKDIG